MSKVSIIVPARHELYLQQTMDSLFKSITGDVEVIVVLDGYWPDPILKDDPRLSIIHLPERLGMRAAINAGVSVAKGEYILKCDAHVIFQEGFDEILQKDCDEDWVVTPVRYSLDADKWEPKSAREKPPVQYEYLSYPYQDGKWVGLHAQYWWKERDRARKEFDIDENFSFQGSTWWAKTEYYKKLIHPMDEEHYGMFIGEPQEIGLKYWLSGGKTMLNKKIWVSHLWKGHPYRDAFKAKYGFSYTRVGNEELKKGNEFSTDFWFNNRWDKRIHNLEWLVEKFWPVPTWNEDRSLWSNLEVGDYVRPGK